MTKEPSNQNLPLACVILAAGLGTRMKSALPKVLHTVAGRSMVGHVVAACQGLGPQKIVVVASPSTKDAIASAVAPHTVVVQETPNGTGDALKAARQALAGFQGHVLVLSADAPLVTTEALRPLLESAEASKAVITVGGFFVEDGESYGRLIVSDQGDLTGIVEAKDATPDELDIQLCNAAIYVFDSAKMWMLIDQIDNQNAKGEYYLTDTVHIAHRAHLLCEAEELDYECAMGVNNRAELAEAEAVMQYRLQKAAMLDGVTMLDPDSVYLSFDTRFGQDVTVGPNVYFGLGVTVGNNATIHAFCHLEKAVVGEGAIVGPFARLRPDAVIGNGAHIGNFVEIKKSEIAPGAKVNHLTYIGDAYIGEKANIGAGTITCNYDGFTKARTHIGAGAFIGSNTALVAPVTVGDGAIIGAGSTITKDVAPDALAVTRAKQTTLEGWASRFRMGKKKAT